MKLGEDSLTEFKSIRVQNGQLTAPKQNDIADGYYIRICDAKTKVFEAIVNASRGDGVPLIMEESFKLSGKIPEYKLIPDELHLTIWS